MSIHSVTDIELGSIGLLGSGTYIRDITIKSGNGDWLKITLFGDPDAEGGSLPCLNVLTTDKVAYNATEIKEASNV